MSRHTFPRSSVLILGPNSIQSLLPSTLISQVEALINQHRLTDAAEVVDQRRRKLEGGLVVDPDEADELRYAYQLIGFQCFTETLFEDAGKHLFNGELDPRVLIGYYPELRGGLFSKDDQLDVYAGVIERMPPEASVDDVICINLVRNYSPHMSPNTRSAPPTAELRRILAMAAEDMLEAFLRKWRIRQSLESGSVNGATRHPPDPVTDTVLAKLYALHEKTTDLYALLNSPHSIIISEVEAAFRKAGQYNALCILYRQTNNDTKLLDTWAKLIEGSWSDPDIPNPLADMIALLTKKGDRALTRQWGIWLTKRDPDRGLQLLMPKETTGGKRRERERPEDDVALLAEIEQANPEAGQRYLEWLVLQRRSSSKDLHTRLALSCIEQLLDSLSDESVLKLWRAKASSYSSSPSTSAQSPSIASPSAVSPPPSGASPSPTSFLSYLASTTPDSPAKRTRLKTILFLAGSTLYNPLPIRKKLKAAGREKVLGLEEAILEGKIGNHREALFLLVHNLHDSSSAEAYCSLGGSVVPPKVALNVAENCALDTWGSLFASTTGKKGAATGKVERQASISEELKKELLKVLLEVYMTEEKESGKKRDRERDREQAARLLNAQAVNLDVIDVIELVPEKWPLRAMTSFLERSFRRTLHTKQEGKIVKHISAGQNLEVKDRIYPIIREEGAIVEEYVESDDEESRNMLDEKPALAEKVVLHLTTQSQAYVTDIPPKPPSHDDEDVEAGSSLPREVILGRDEKLSEVHGYEVDADSDLR
ncbi:hypothetical protein BDQ12DRAFT_735823 [Crucibulum laeve]|uniref:Uncharacterized protein n=1 Tax=Crucibulum laeve TaxID=68775 RepID=A0A5C3LYC7_9AGAR|nr:hypothetical protein BDQ12DRAFT_735823 [Crucibulum laeve]